MKLQTGLQVLDKRTNTICLRHKDLEVGDLWFCFLPWGPNHTVASMDRKSGGLVAGPIYLHAVYPAAWFDRYHQRHKREGA